MIGVNEIDESTVTGAEVKVALVLVGNFTALNTHETH